MGTAPPELSPDKHCSHPDTSLFLITQVDFSESTVALTLTPFSVPSLLTSSPCSQPPSPWGLLSGLPPSNPPPTVFPQQGPCRQSHRVTSPCSEPSPSSLSHSEEELRPPNDPQDSLRPKALPQRLWSPSAPLLQVFSASFIFLQPHWP